MIGEFINYPVIGGTYRHYKGGLYEVFTLATHSETNEPMVIYKSLLFGSIHARPLTSWNTKGVTKLANGREVEVTRFDRYYEEV